MGDEKLLYNSPHFYLQYYIASKTVVWNIQIHFQIQLELME